MVTEIGNTLKLRNDIDPAGKVTTWFRQGLNIVDIMPAHFKMQLDVAKDSPPKFKVYNTDGGGTSDPIAKYKQRCKTYGLKETSMLRLWLTGDSTFQEEFSTEYQTNKFESMVNGLLGGAVGSYGNLFKNVDAGVGTNNREQLTKDISKYITKATKAVKSVAGNDSVVTQGTQALANVSKVLVSNLLDNKFLAIPKTYSGSTYNPALSFNVRLVSPYGHPKAIQKFIVEPLAYLLLLAPPTTSDGVTYGSSEYVSVRAYGIADIDLAVIENISIRRGGNDVAYNKHRQPLSIDVNLSIKPATSGFAAEQSHGADFKDKIYVSGLKGGVALDLADKTPVEVASGGTTMRSSMVTVGNVLNSFKKMPYPDSISGKSPPTIKSPKKQSVINDANTNASQNMNKGHQTMNTIIV